MAQKPEQSLPVSLAPYYEEALSACGLVDDLTHVLNLDPRPYRYAEGEFICQRGDEANCLWVIVTGSIAVRSEGHTHFTRSHGDVVGELNLLGNGYRRFYDLVANESSVEVLVIEKQAIEAHPEREVIWRNIAKIISLKLKSASTKIASLSRQLEDDTRILHAYTNEYALGRRLQSGGGSLTDYQVDLAVIWFSDIVDFSRHTLRLTPDRTADIVQRFFNAQSHPIASHGGHIDKFIGDGLMAFWVVSEGKERGKQCLAALRAAEEATEAISRISVGQTHLGLRIGLHVGMVMSGDFGSTLRHQFTLIGPEVNKASRLEELHAEDVIQGCSDLRDIRMSAEFFNELSETVQRRYDQHSIARAKNIGEIELYS